MKKSFLITSIFLACLSLFCSVGCKNDAELPQNQPSPENPDPNEKDPAEKEPENSNSISEIIVQDVFIYPAEKGSYNKTTKTLELSGNWQGATLYTENLEVKGKYLCFVPIRPPQ